MPAPIIRRDGKKAKILYVEDNRENRMLVRAILEADGYTIVDAEDGLSGVEQDQGRFLAHGGLDAGQPVLGVDDGVAIGLENRPHEHAILAVVLDVEDLRATAVPAYGCGHEGSF